MSDTNSIKNVAIVGATGHLGSRMVTELLKTEKHSITAITRQDSTASFPGSVNVARVDYTSQDSLVSALKGHDFLIITLGVMVPADTHANIVNAAAKAGIPYIMPNCYGYDIHNKKLFEESLYGSALNAIADVEKSGASYVALCCGFWYEWSLGTQSFGFDFKNRKAVLFDEGKTKINASTLEQCGKAVAALLSLPIKSEGNGKRALEDWKNKPLYVSSFLLSQRDMLDSLNRVMDTTDRDWSIEYDSSEKRYVKGIEDMKKGDHTGFVRAMYSRVFYPNGGGDFESELGTDNKKLGLGKEDLDSVTRFVVEKNPFVRNMTG